MQQTEEEEGVGMTMAAAEATSEATREEEEEEHSSQRRRRRQTPPVSAAAEASSSSSSSRSEERASSMPIPQSLPPPSSSTTAQQQQQQQVRSVNGNESSSHNRNSSSSNSRIRPRYKRRTIAPPGKNPGRDKRAAIKELLLGAALYGSCVFLPPLVGRAYVRLYEGSSSTTTNGGATNNNGGVGGGLFWSASSSSQQQSSSEGVANSRGILGGESSSMSRDGWASSLMPGWLFDLGGEDDGDDDRSNGSSSSGSPGWGQPAIVDDAADVGMKGLVGGGGGNDKRRRRGRGGRRRGRGRSSSDMVDDDNVPHSTSTNLFFNKHYGERHRQDAMAASVACAEEGLCGMGMGVGVGGGGEGIPPPPRGSSSTGSSGNTNLREVLRGRIMQFERAVTDVQLVFALAVLLAIIRVMLVHLLVPKYLAPQPLAAMMRCKSMHLLSAASVQFSPDQHRYNQRKGRFSVVNLNALGNSSGGGGLGSSSSLMDAAAAIGHEEDDIGYTLDDDDDDDDDGHGGYDYNTNNLTGVRAEDNMEPPERPKSPLVSRTWSKFRSSIRRSLGHEPIAPYEKEGKNNISTERLFSAPRYATAMFRLLYCTASCISALILFRNADFWPVYVGGRTTASTTNCWDLSGSVALGSLDADFDHRNAALHYFFLVQASYQIHSLCFHVVSMGLLLRYGERGSGRLLSMKSSMQSYLRPTFEHLIALSLILGSYLFSSVRRLGAVGIFTLEFSSIFLQFLTVCVHSPDQSRLQRPDVILFVHRFVAVPMFVYCRFFVLPFVVGYSAAFESQAWLDQIEHVWSSHTGEVLYGVFNGLLCAIVGLNVIYFQRLLFHPQIQQITSSRRQEVNSFH